MTSHPAPMSAVAPGPKAPLRPIGDTGTHAIDGRITDRLAAYAHAASKRRGLTLGELSEDMADELNSGERFGLAEPFLRSLAAAFAGSRPNLHIECDPALRLPATELAPIGMVVSEAVSNAIEHAFPAGRDGRIWVRLAAEGERLRLTIRDDGIGMPDLTPERVSGRGLIDMVAEQLGGYARLGSAPFGGALVTVVFPRTS